MATTIQIKRSPNVAAATTADLLEGELAYSYDKSNNGVGAKLYIEVQNSGGGEAIHTIGGKYYTDKVDAASSAATASVLVQRDANGSFAANNISLTGNITLGGTKLTGGGSGLFVDPVRAASSGNVVYYNPATKELTYALAGAAATADKLTTARDIGLAGDLTGNVSFDGSQNVTLTATIAANSVALGTDTTGDYVAGVSSGTGVNVSGSGGEGSTVTVDLAASGVSASTYGGTGTTPVLVVDTYGRITSASNVTTTVANTNITGNIIASQITSIANTQITGNFVTSVGGSTGVISNAMIAASLTGQNVSVGNLTVSSSINASNIFQTGANNVSIELGAATGIIAITAGSSSTGFLPSGQINLGGTSTIAGGTFSGSGFTAGTSQTDLFQNRGGNVTVQVGTGGSIANTYIFGNDGRFYAPNDVTVAGKLTGNLINATGLPVSTGISGLGANQTTLLAANAQTGVSATTYGGSTNIPVITVDSFGRVTSAANIAVSTSFTLAADSGTSDTLTGGDTLRISGGTGIDTTVTDNTFSIAIETTGVAASTYGGAASVGSFTVDTTGRLTNAGNVAIAIPSSAITTDIALGTQTSGAYVANLVAGTGITLSGLGNEGTTPTITNSGVTSITGTTGEIEVSAATGSITIGLPNDVVIGNNLTITGDLIVNGTAVTMNTATVIVEDPLVKFGNANPSDSLDIGFFGEYVSSGTKWAGLFRDASDTGKFKLFNDLTVNPTSNVVDTASYTVATLVSNLTGGTVSGLTANIAVADGGTGRGTITNNSILYGQGTSAVGMATGSAYQVLQLNASGVPVFAGIDGGTY